MKVKCESEASWRIAARNPYLWMDESEDEDDIFMPSSKGNRAASSSKGKSAASSSKGKCAASMEEDDDNFM